jgi:hypothetical protein
MCSMFVSKSSQCYSIIYHSNQLVSDHSYVSIVSHRILPTYK